MILELMCKHAGAVALLAMAVAIPAHAAGDPLARHTWKSRLLVVIAPDASDATFVAQRRLFRAVAVGARERDLVLVEAVGSGADARAIRARFAVGGDAFRAILVGKDGGAKLVSETPLGPERLFAEIDSMPMRAEEMRRRGR